MHFFVVASNLWANLNHESLFTKFHLSPIISYRDLIEEQTSNYVLYCTIYIYVYVCARTRIMKVKHSNFKLCIYDCTVMEYNFLACFYCLLYDTKIKCFRLSFTFPLPIAIAIDKMLKNIYTRSTRTRKKSFNVSNVWMKAYWNQ